jgi:hypothetical protein
MLEWKSEVVYDWIILFVKLFPLHFLEEKLLKAIALSS